MSDDQRLRALEAQIHKLTARVERLERQLRDQPQPKTVDEVPIRTPADVFPMFTRRSKQ